MRDLTSPPHLNTGEGKAPCPTTFLTLELPEALTGHFLTVSHKGTFSVPSQVVSIWGQDSQKVVPPDLQAEIQGKPPPSLKGLLWSQRPKALAMGCRKKRGMRTQKKTPPTVTPRLPSAVSGQLSSKAERGSWQGALPRTCLQWSRKKGSESSIPIP